MLSIVNRVLSRVMGSKADRDLKVLTPYVGAINQVWQTLTELPDDELRARSRAQRERIREGLSEITGRIAALNEQAATDRTLSLLDKEALFAEVDRLEKERNVALEQVLNQELPEAFALVKETARRLAQVGHLDVEATDWDVEYAATHPHVTLEGGRARWANQWSAAGAPITWDMVHYDVQLIGGVVLHQGKIAEMATGEGKTLVATLPMFLNAQAGYGVHIVTVNDYLARRDSEWMGPLMAFHGLRVDCIDRHQPGSAARRAAYEADITYGTNNEFGFDYLRDNMVQEASQLVQRKLHYAMVDEVDSVLVDDARTPLIISGPMAAGDRHEYEALKPRVARLVEAQKAIVNKLLTEARRSLDNAGATSVEREAGGLALFRAYRGLPKAKPLIKLLSEPGARALLQKTENVYLADNQRLMPEADRELLFTIDEKNNSIELTERGIDFMTGQHEEPDFFVLPDISLQLGALDKDTELSDTERLERKDQVLSQYSQKSERIHTVQQLLKAYTLFEREVEYIIVEGKVLIVDEQTGRVLEGRRYSDGLHQAIEAKENVKIEDATQTYATVTLQNYFRMYHKLAGMTGTAETEAGEFWTIYKLDVTVIPTNRNVVRADQQDKVYKTVREKYQAVVEEIQALVAQGRPVLVGTTSVENSEVLSRMLRLKGITDHQVLNAKHHQREAEIVARAGQPGTVTIATNMAGRGTDIKLTAESRAAGGLAIIGTERHESRRVDRQLRGRAGRQGDPGSSQFFVSLEDLLMRLFGSERIVKIMDRMGMQEGEVIQHSMVTRSIERAQRKVEENNFGIRKRLLEYDDVMNAQREVIYRRRRNALYGDRLPLDVQGVIFRLVEEAAQGSPGAAGYGQFALRMMHLYGLDPALDADTYQRTKPADLARQLYPKLEGLYRERLETHRDTARPVFEQIAAREGDRVTQIITPFFGPGLALQLPLSVKALLEGDVSDLRLALERSVTLLLIDQHWKEHLRDMDDLRQSVQNASIEQKDPLLIYKFEALGLFRKFITRVNEEIVTFLFRAQIPTELQLEPEVGEADYLEAPQAPRGPQGGGRPAQQAQQTADLDELEALLGAMAPRPVGPGGVAGNGAGSPRRTPQRNDRVTVRYPNGQLKTVKYKQVEEDVRRGLCQVVDVA